MSNALKSLDSLATNVLHNYFSVQIKFSDVYLVKFLDILTNKKT